MKGDDAELVTRARRGDPEAFEALVEKYKKPVYRIARSSVNRHDDADDLAQEIFIRAWEGIRKFKGRSTFKTWLFRIAVNTSINYHRRVGEKVEREIELKEEGLRRSDDAPLDTLLKGERKAKLREMIGRLPGKQRKTLILKIDGEMKYSEIAKAMGCSEGTAKANFFHAVNRLRKELEGLNA